MTFKKIFHMISHVLEKEKIHCLLIGGFAVNYYHVSRQTADIDFLITREDYQRLRPLLIKAGYREEYIQEMSARLGHREPGQLDVDFLFADQETLDQLIRSGRTVMLADRSFVIPSLDHLLALKLHAMKNNPQWRLHKDLADILDLIRMNRVDVRTKKFATLCRTYGNEKLYQTLLRSVSHG